MAQVDRLRILERGVLGSSSLSGGSFVAEFIFFFFKWGLRKIRSLSTEWRKESLIQIKLSLRGAWTDHCFPAPFSWFLHETGLECLKITSPRCFSLKCQRKDSKKVKEHRQFRGVLGRWRTAAVERYNLSCLSAMSKNGRLRSFSSALGYHLARKSLWWPTMLVSNKKQEFEQRKRIKLFDDFWVRAYRFDFSPRRRPRARSM